jgi:hypothetical protein
VIDCDVVFFAEDQQGYKWMNLIFYGKTNFRDGILYRPFCDNFGGRSNVILCIEFLKKISTEDYDKVIFCDADIILERNVFDQDFDFGGIRDRNNIRHFSGQFLIFSQWLFDKVIHYERYGELFKIFIDSNQSIADDTIFSYVATAFTEKTFDFEGLGYWRHEKNYHLEQFYYERQSIG